MVLYYMYQIHKTYFYLYLTHVKSFQYLHQAYQYHHLNINYENIFPIQQ